MAADLHPNGGNVSSAIVRFDSQQLYETTKISTASLIGYYDRNKQRSATRAVIVIVSLIDRRHGADSLE
jgi:hypothetical protein